MPGISRGVPAYASSALNPAGDANDSDYGTFWQSNGGPGWLAYDLSGVPAIQRGPVVVGWYNDPLTSPYDHAFFGEPAYNNLRSYTIEGNAGPGGGSPPATGWVTLASVVNNTYHSREHVVDMRNGHDLQLLLNARRNVNEILLVFRGDEHGSDAATKSREKLFLEASDRKHATA